LQTTKVKAPYFQNWAYNNRWEDGAPL